MGLFWRHMGLFSRHIGLDLRHNTVDALHIDTHTLKRALYSVWKETYNPQIIPIFNLQHSTADALHIDTQTLKRALYSVRKETYNPQKSLIFDLRHSTADALHIIVADNVKYAYKITHTHAHTHTHAQKSPIFCLEKDQYALKRALCCVSKETYVPSTEHDIQPAAQHTRCARTHTHTRSKEPYILSQKRPTCPQKSPIFDQKPSTPDALHTIVAANVQYVNYEHTRIHAHTHTLKRAQCFISKETYMPSKEPYYRPAAQHSRCAPHDCCRQCRHTLPSSTSSLQSKNTACTRRWCPTFRIRDSLHFVVRLKVTSTSIAKKKGKKKKKKEKKVYASLISDISHSG